MKLHSSVFYSLFFLIAAAMIGPSAARPTDTSRLSAEKKKQPASKDQKSGVLAKVDRPNSSSLTRLLRYKGKAGRSKRNVFAATREGRSGKFQLVALAPGWDNDGNCATSIREMPSFWWFQNESTQRGELEFVLSRLGGRFPVEILQANLSAMTPGFNRLALEDASVNPKGITLEPGVTYQWTLNLRHAERVTPVYSRIQIVANSQLSQLVSTAPLAPATLRALANQGNWFELFDAVASSTQSSSGSGVESTRDGLLRDGGLLCAVRGTCSK